MKSIHPSITLFFCAAICLMSCQQDFLELTPQDKVAAVEVWKDPQLIELAINEMYQTMPDGFNRNWYMLGTATDDGENSYGWPAGQSFNRGDYTSSNYPMAYVWSDSYNMIRQANLFFANVAAGTLNPETENRLRGEVSFLRAFYYFILMKHYGGVPILEEAKSLNDDFNIPRSTKEEVIALIIKDLDQAIDLLPETLDAPLLGKATKGAALALKGRTLLYAERWAESASVNKEVMALGLYELFPDYHDLFIAANENNQEVIFDKQFQEPQFQQWVHLFNQPIGYSGGWGGTGPTQELVDAYEMIDGKSIDESPVYNSESPYENRDPRLYATVFYEGSMWRGRAIETRIGGLDGIEKNGDATKTGYYMKKFLDESHTDWVNIGGSNNWIYMRYAEVLLNYAEAQNEAVGPDESVYAAINEVRARTSVNMPPLEQGLSKDQMRDKIRHERRVELAFEEHRFFDLRRWRLGELLNQPIHGMRIGPNGELTGADSQGNPYGRIEVETRTFTSKNYLAPIPQNEIDKLGSGVLEQNPGY